jgi:hypothetical protein
MVRVVFDVLLCVVDCVAGSGRGDEKEKEDEKGGESNSKTGGWVDCEETKREGCVCSDCADEL